MERTILLKRGYNGREAIDSIIINVGDNYSDSDSELELTDESDASDGNQEAEVLRVLLDD